MGASSFKACVSREGEDTCWARVRGSNHDDEERRVEDERNNVLDFMDDGDDSGVARRRLTRFFTIEQIDDLDNFKHQLEDSNKKAPRANTLIGGGYGPWGIKEQKGGDANSWDDVRGEDYQVRGASYLDDKKKVTSAPRIGELLVVDLFQSPTDIANVAACVGAKTIQRLRRDGEQRRLVVLNFRLSPLQLIAVWAIPSNIQADTATCPAERLFSKFFHDMSDEERTKRLKIIPKILQGPWPVKKLVGQNCPAILGKGIPIFYFSADNVLEISVSIAASSAAQRISKIMMRAGSALDLELVLLLEGWDEEELPEGIMGGLRIAHAELTTVRWIDPNESELDNNRPAGLPTE